ncbi:hypothetical protein [Amycolatopsis kentuckyensis]|uniref:hypothetical protein n=1 Tax=Amycolatopsis kentuckyensis TaxID=218823 RepID=UPI000A38FBD7|nr:hypothetical protein [Amycolatopsis kentuckyensis]
MSQDIKREREAVVRVGSRHGIHLYDGDTAIGTMLTVEWDSRVVTAFKDAKYYRDMAVGDHRRVAELTAELRNVNAKLAEANDALERAGRRDPRVQRVFDWLDRKEATIRDRVNFAIAPADGFSDLGAIESRAAKLRHAQYDSKLLGELRGLLAPATEDVQPSVRYWRCGCGYFYRQLPGRELEAAERGDKLWKPSPFKTFEGMNEDSCDVQELTYAGLTKAMTS